MVLTNSRLYFAFGVVLMIVGASAYFSGIDLHPWAVALWFVGVVASLCLTYVPGMRFRRRLEAGMSLLKESDFASRICATGFRDVDTIVGKFNGLMNDLRAESHKNERQKLLFIELLKNIPIGVAITDFDGIIVECNAKFMECVADGNFDSLSGTRYDRIPGEVGDNISKVAKGPAAKGSTFRTSRNTSYYCSILNFEEHGFTRYFILVEPISQIVSQTERETFNKIIRTMAHEVNNTLGGVILLTEAFSAASNDAEMKTAVDACTARCRGLGNFVDKFAGMAKIPKPVVSSIDMKSFLESNMYVLEALGKRKVPLVWDLPNDSFSVEADPDLLIHCITNVTKNAVESVEISGSVEPMVKITYDSALRTLRVIDNGIGINAERSKKIFTPLFSDKPDGHGLGLMFVAEVLDAHGFAYRLYTDTEDHLTRFEITF